ncbi:MAG: LuxR C-terminal-related transcriptional regulator [Spirochaetaceae bacterium]|nr:LuxR C-terminal-related transcriptional regulator [Spirochaetaceae bacterium]
MRLEAGPLRVRLEAEGAEADELAARATRDGLVLAAPGEAADLIARLAHAAGSARAPASDLSPRELEILGYLVDGWSNAEIASVLRIGVRTVRFHLEGLYGKLRVSRRGEAAREALRLGLVRFDV